MIVEAGHFALASGARSQPRAVRGAVLGRAQRRRGADGRRRFGRARAVPVRRPRLRGARLRPSRLGLLRSQRRRELAQRYAGDLQILGRLGQPRGLDAALVPDPLAVRRAGGDDRRRPAPPAARRRARGAGADRRCVPRLHPGNLGPVPAAGAAAVRGARPQPDPAGPWPRDPSAAALCRLRRLLHRVLVRRRRADRGPHRRGLGAVRPALHPRRLGLPDARHRDGFLLGLLHAGLGRLLVLGPRGERLADALACGHRVPALGRGDGEARRPEGLDDLSLRFSRSRSRCSARSWCARAC